MYISYVKEAVYQGESYHFNGSLVITCTSIILIQPNKPQGTVSKKIRLAVVCKVINQSLLLSALDILPIVHTIHTLTYKYI